MTRAARRIVRSRSTLALSILLGAGVGLFGCAAPTPTDPPPAIAQVHYELDWDLGRAQVTTLGFVTQNDLGYRVGLKQGYLVSHSAQLTPCPDEAAEHPWLDLLAPRIAHAGHGDDYGLTAVLDSLVESIRHRVPRDWAQVEVDQSAGALRYCEAFYLVAKAGAAVREMPEGVDMLGSSMLVEGSWQAPGLDWDDDPWQDFSIRTGLANGAVLDLDSQAGPAWQLNSAPTQVRIVRDLGALFDGLDFQTMDAEALEDALIRAVIEATTIEVTTLAPTG